MMTFEELAKLETGTVLHDKLYLPFRGLVLRGPAAMLAYIGLPRSHPYWGMKYDDLPSHDVHWGWTFSADGDGDFRPRGWWWIGWDYGHAGDMSWYDLDPRFAEFRGTDRHKWTVPEVVTELEAAIKSLPQ